MRLNRRSAPPLALAACLVLGLPVAPASAGDHHGPGSSLDRTDPMRVSERYNDRLSRRARRIVLPGLAVPFPCGQSWTGSTRSSHSPSANSVDFNAPGDEGKAVVASAAGTVTTAYAKPKGGYGRWVVIDHGDGTSTLYAHLKTVLVVPGQSIDQGSVLGSVGSSGNSTGPHLHYEQKSGRVVATPAFGGTAFRWGTVSSDNCDDVPLAGDFTGDGIAEVAVYRREATPTFHVSDHEGDLVVPFGTSVEEPLVGDWDGDGLADVGARSPRSKVFRLRTHDGLRRITLGMRTDKPVVGDWEGTGADQVGVYRTSTGRFRLRRADGSIRVVALGDRNDVPLTGDFDGDGRTDLAVYDPATSTFTLRTETVDGAVTRSTAVLGVRGDLPVVADWDGDGVDDLGVWTPSTATFTLQMPQTQASGRTSVRTVAFGRPR